MTKSLYRSDGVLLRVPTDLGYPDAGKLWRGNEICCPGWDIGDYSEFLPASDGLKSSIYTPKYITVTAMADIVDCAGCGIGAAAELSAIGGATKVLLTQGAPSLWAGAFSNGHDWIFYLELSDGSPGFETNCVVSTLVGGLSKYAFQYKAATQEDLRLGDTWASVFVIGDCCTGGQVAHSGELTFVAGDQT